MIILSVPDRVGELLNQYRKAAGAIRLQAALANQITAIIAANNSPIPTEEPTEELTPQSETNQDLGPRIWNKNRAKYKGGVCGECFEPIEQGEIVYLTEGTRARHIRCPPQPPDIIR